MEWKELYKIVVEDLKERKSKSTARGYITDLKAFNFIDKPNRADIRKKRREWQKQGISGKTILHRFSAVKWVLKNYPLEFSNDSVRDMLAEMSSRNVTVVHKTAEYATKEMTDTIIKNSDARTGLCVAMMYYAGLRVSEVARSKLSDWDIHGERPESNGRACLYIPAESTIKDELDLTKTKEARVIPIILPLMRAFNRYVNGMRKEQGNYEGLILGVRGEVCVRSIWRMVSIACKENGYDNLHDHSFRHGLATRLAKANINAQQIAHIMGHKSIQTTMRYIHLNVSDSRNAINTAMSTDI